MSRSKKYIGLALAGLLAWTLAHPATAAPTDPHIAVFENSLRPPVLVDGAPDVKWTLAERMAHWKVPGVSVAVIRHGKLAWAKGYGVKQVGNPDAIDPQTMFSVGSISKVGTAVMTLRLVQDGKLALDQDVNSYMRRWRVPDNDFTRGATVTLRGLMSHSAGMTVWGFPDFQPNEALPALLDTLDGKAPSKTPAVRVEYPPGTQARYAGGGVEVEQLIIEDVTGLSFKDAARKYLLDPLGMTRSTYEQPLPASYGNIAKAHDMDGKPTALPRGWESMPETAASGLWATPSDFAKLLIALMAAYHGDDTTFLHKDLANDMMTEVGPSTVGLGPFMDGRGQTRRFSHAGANDSYKAWFEGHLATGDGVVIFTNGASEGDLRGEVRSAIATAEGWDPAFNRTRHIPQVNMTAEEQAALTGLYEVDTPPDAVGRRAAIALTLAGYKLDNDHIGFLVSAKDGKLFVAEPHNQRTIRLLPEDHSHFVPESRSEISLEFARDYRGTVTSMIVRINDTLLVAKRMPRG